MMSIKYLNPPSNNMIVSEIANNNISTLINYPCSIQILIQTIRMSLNQYKERVDSFVQRIRKAFNLEEDSQDLVPHRDTVLTWIVEQIAKFKEQKDKLNSSGIFQGLLNKTGYSNSQFKKIEQSEKILLNLKEIFKGNTFMFNQDDLQHISVPEEVVTSFKHLKNKTYPNYFGVAYSPLMKHYFIKTKQSYDRCIKKVVFDEMKLNNVGSDYSNIIQSQRYMVEHLFNRLLNKESQLSTVMKIVTENKNTDKVIEIYCCIQDLADQPKKTIPLSQLRGNQVNHSLYAEKDEEKVYIDQTSLFHGILTQLIVVPIQTVVSDYVLIHNQENNKLHFKKMHKDAKQDIFHYMREHPSLRNPLTYFRQYVKFHDFSIQNLKKDLSVKVLNANFYEILNILFNFLSNDYTVPHRDGRCSSLCINETIIGILWSIFHDMVVLSDWLEEVIFPIKETVTLYQIKNKMFPIAADMLKQTQLTYEEYRNHLLNLPIQNYLSINVPKLTIQKYKDKYISLESIQPIVVKNNHVYSAFFAKTMRNYDLANTNIYQSLYFLNFIAVNCHGIYDEDLTMVIQPSWRNKKIWKEIVQIRNKQFASLPYMSISLDLLALTFDFDSLEFSDLPFESIKNDLDQQKLMLTVRRLEKILRHKYEKKSDEYLSFLLEKSFKYKKYKVAKYLIEARVHIRHYEDIFNFSKQSQVTASRFTRITEKAKLIDLMKTKQPEMFRRYLWQELINVKLKTQIEGQKSRVVSIGKGDFYVQDSLKRQLNSKNVMSNTLSRKDYMFCNNRMIAKVEIDETAAYIQLTQFPLLRYFYSLFLKQLEKGSLIINFCGFFSQKGNLFHLLQSIPYCFNFQKGLQHHTESQLKNYLDEDDISEAIILSIILMPTNVQLKNIIISPELGKEECNQTKGLFIIDFNDFYQKNGFEISGLNNCLLKVKNSLFLFDQMENIIGKKLIKKYSQMQVMQIINKVFKKCSSFIRQMNTIRPRKQGERQLYSLIFQNGFAFTLAERMFKIKKILCKRLRDKVPMSHYQLLEVVDPQLRYYYEEVRRTSHQLIEREKNMLDDSFKKFFIVNESLISFIGKGSPISNQNQNFPHHYMRFNFQGPSQALKGLHEQALKFSIYNGKITTLKDFSHETIQYFIEHIDLSEYQKQQRQQLFDKIQRYSLEYLNKEMNCLPLSVIRVSHVEGLKERHLKFSDERLKRMIFESVSCTESQFNNLIKKYHNLHNLKLIGVTGLEKISEGFINIANTIELKNMKTLTINRCPNLQTIDLKCNQLKYLTIRNNASLTHIYINSKKLKNIDCSQCQKLHLQNIGIYIFMKRNVLLCKNSCDGDVKRLQHPNYAIYLTRILRYLCNRFQESSNYKLDLVLTLNKLELIDEKIYKFGNSKMGSNWGSLLNFVTKAGTQTLRITQEQIIKIFLSNENVDVLSVDELLKIQLDSLTNIVKCLDKAKIKKEFKQIIFHQIIRHPQSFDQHLKLVELIFNNIQVEKVFSIKLTLVSEIECQYYIRLIQFINNKDNLQKLQITFLNSVIDDSFFEALFNLKADKNKIVKLTFQSCQLSISQNLSFDNQPFMKEIIFIDGQIGNLRFLEKFGHMTTVELNGCKVPNSISSFYSSIGKLEYLKQLALINLKNNIFENDLQLDILFKQLRKIPKIQSLNFSQNCLNFQELTIFSKQIFSLKLYQLTLIDFYDPTINKYIEHFLYHEHLRIIQIQFRIKNNKDILESFINQLSMNSSIIKLKIQTDAEIQSTFFQKLRHNSKLEQIQSNQPIPNWLINHISNNSQSNHSAIFQSEPFEILSSQLGKKQDYYRIGLSLDGGGVRGLLLATELDYICRNVKQPLHKIFDCIGGTSIGGILALGSTGTLDGHTPVCSTKDLMEIFELYSNKIFKKSQIKQLTNLFDTKYDVSSFQDLLYSYLKDCKLSDTLKQTNVVVTAVNRLTNEDIIFRSINSIFDRNRDFYMRDIARATSAAPTYFPSAQIKNINANQKYSCIDGGVGLNNPSKLVIDDVIKITQNQSSKGNYFLLSLGTGKLINDAIPESAGIINLAPIIDSFTESANFFIEKDLAQNYKGHYVRVSPLINMSRKDVQMDNTKPQIMQIYKKAGMMAAEQEFSNKIAYGKFKNQSLIEWLTQNTARKYDM